MSSRGSAAENGHITDTEYLTIFVTKTGVKILVGSNSSYHSLPDLAHTPNSVYAKLYPNGCLKEMRFYDEKGKIIVEIAVHSEPNINNGSREPIVHFHKYDGLQRSQAYNITPEIKEKYKEYLEDFDLYDRC